MELMSDNWEEFVDARGGIEKKIYHFYYEVIEAEMFQDLYMIRDEEGNILGGTSPEHWDKLLQNPDLQKARQKKVKQIQKVAHQATREKKEGRALITIHKITRSYPRKN